MKRHRMLHSGSVANHPVAFPVRTVVCLRCPWCFRGRSRRSLPGSPPGVPTAAPALRHANGRAAIPNRSAFASGAFTHRRSVRDPMDARDARAYLGAPGTVFGLAEFCLGGLAIEPLAGLVIGVLTPGLLGGFVFFFFPRVFFVAGAPFLPLVCGVPAAPDWADPRERLATPSAKINADRFIHLPQWMNKQLPLQRLFTPASNQQQTLQDRDAPSPAFVRGVFPRG